MKLLCPRPQGPTLKGARLDIDYIVPLWKPDKFRQHNRALLERSVQRQAGVKVHLIVVEQDPLLFPVFNKSWLINRGVKAGQSHHLFIGDIDVPLLDDDHLISVIHWATRYQYEWAFAWNRLVYEGLPGEPPERDDWPEPGVQEGGVVYFTRPLWDRMGGANEWIQELRGPDNDLALRARFLTRYHVGYAACLFHKWHPRSPMKSTRFRRQNEQVLAYTRKHPEVVIDILRQQDRGNLHRPYCATSRVPFPIVPLHRHV